MFFIPLSQVESVELVVHALKIAGGQADCRTCPAHRVCMKQCVTIASAVEGMIRRGELPSVNEEASPSPAVREPEPPAPVAASEDEPDKPTDPPKRGGHLRIIK